MSYLDRLGRWDRQRYDKVLQEMSEIEKRVWELILWRFEEAPIRGDELALKTGIDVRHVRDIVRDLRMKYFLPVGSTNRFPHGYYVMTSEHECQEMEKRLWKRGWAILRVAYKLKKMAAALPSFRQIRLELENEHGEETTTSHDG